MRSTRLYVLYGLVLRTSVRCTLLRRASVLCTQVHQARPVFDEGRGRQAFVTFGVLGDFLGDFWGYFCRMKSLCFAQDFSSKSHFSC